MVETIMNLCVEIGKKSVFLNLEKNLVINFHWSSSIMKIYIICFVHAQLPYLEKILFLRYSSKCSQPIRLQDFQINYFSRINWWNSLIFYMLIQIHKKYKLIKHFWLGMVKNGCSQSVLGTHEHISRIIEGIN